MSSLNFIHQTKEKDHIFIKNLLEASEKHNKNLTELIVILKKVTKPNTSIVYYILKKKKKEHRRRKVQIHQICQRKH